MSEDVRNLYFRRSNGEYRLIGTNVTEEKAYVLMQAFMFEHDFRSYYIREWAVNGERWFDVGSHTEFFVWKKED